MNIDAGPNDVITRLMQAIGVKSERELSRHFGYGATTMTSKRQRGRVPYEECVQIARTRGIDLNWLIFGTGVNPLDRLHDDVALPANTEVVVPAGHTSIPCYSLSASASDLARDSDMALVLDSDQLREHRLVTAQLLAVTVVGDAMAPTLAEHCRVVIDRTRRHPDGVFLLSHGERLLIRRIQQLPTSGWRLICDNPAYPADRLSSEQLRAVAIIGKVVLRQERVG